jgi:FdhD protein
LTVKRDDMKLPRAGTVKTEWLEIGRSTGTLQGDVIEEALVTIYINGFELVTIMCTPTDLEPFGLGFILNEGLVEELESIDHVHVSMQSCCVDIWTRHPVQVPERRIITSGCGGGVTFEAPEIGLTALQEDLRINAEQFFEVFTRLQESGSLYARSRGVHSAGLTDGHQILAMAEDVGRHNTIDKLRGICLQSGIEPRGKTLLTTGRVSSEILKKAARMRCPLVASRNSPTSLSIVMAEALNITLVGYVRRGSMRVYSHPERIHGIPVGKAVSVSSA